MDKYTSICSMPRAHWRTFKNDRNAVVWLNCRDGFFAFFGHQGLEYVVALAHQNRDYRLTIVTTPIPSGQLFLNRQVGATEIETTNPPEIRKARPATPWAAPFSVDAADLPQAEGTDATPAIPFDEGVDANPALPVGAAPPPAGVGARVAQPFQG